MRLSGSATISKPACARRASSTKGTSGMSYQPNLFDLHSAISSPASGSGPTPPASPDGRTTDPSGAEVPLASLSARAASAAGLMMSGTYGPHGSTLSKSIALTSLLASKLRRKTASLGSTLYILTWRERVTPRGRSISALRASERPTSGNVSGFSGWPTATAEKKGPDYTAKERAEPVGLSLQTASAMAGWSTASARDWKDSPGMAEIAEDGRERLDQLPRQAHLAGWSTTTVQDGESSARHGYMIEGNQGSTLLDHARLAGWAAPAANDAEKRGIVADPKPDSQTHVGSQAQLAGWPTSSATDGDRAGSGITAGMSGRSLTQMAAMLEGPARLTASGEMRIGSSAEMERGGQLSPEHSLWLMGLSFEWVLTAPSKAGRARKC